MSQIDDVVDKLNELDSWAQWGVGIVATLLTLTIARILMKKVILDFVRRTSFDWDDNLYAPVSKRFYLFILFLGIQLTMTWVLGESDSFVESMAPFFEAIFIILTASLLSVFLKIISPISKK